FREVVCDNVVEAIWSPAEATQIGFTQKYAETLGKRSPQLAMLATLPPNIAIGLTASGSAGSFNISTRIMVPYGRFLATNLGQLLATGSKRSRVCLDADCVERAKSAGSIDRILTVRVNKLRVAE